MQKAPEIAGHVYLACRRPAEESHPMQRFLILLILSLPGLLFAELPPSAYEAMQVKASEFLNIEVLQVDIEAGKTSTEQRVHIMALVGKVNRSSNNVKDGDVVNIVYTVTSHPAGWSGPREIPILSEKDKTVAYLQRVENSLEYQPTAGAMSVRNF